MQNTILLFGINSFITRYGKCLWQRMDLGQVLKSVAVYWIVFWYESFWLLSYMIRIETSWYRNSYSNQPQQRSAYHYALSYIIRNPWDVPFSSRNWAARWSVNLMYIHCILCLSPLLLSFNIFSGALLVVTKPAHMTRWRERMSNPWKKFEKSLKLLPCIKLNHIECNTVRDTVHIQTKMGFLLHTH